jgi:Family of unknown function (DUF6114)
MPARSQDSEGSAGLGPAEPLHSGDQDPGEPASGEPADAGPGPVGAEPGPAVTEPPPAGTEPEPIVMEPAEAAEARPARHGAPGRFSRGRASYRRWRRSRPFWGGLIALLGGAEIALSERIPLAIVVHLGAQGIAGLLVPVVLMLCAVLLWFNPAQRLFYSILAVLSALGSFITSNLGGFILGGLLGIVGGCLAFAWVPGDERHRGPAREGEPGEGTGPAEGPDDRPSEGLALFLDDRPADGEREGYGPPESGTALHAVPVPLGLAILGPMLHPLFSTFLVSLGFLVPAVTVNTGTGTSPSAGTAVTLTSPSPSPSPATSTSSSSSPSPSPTLSPSPTASPSSADPSASPSSEPQRVRKLAAAPALAVSQAQSNLTAGSAHLAGLSYDGVAKVPTADGGSVAMLKFSMSSMTLSDGTKLTISEGGVTTVTSSPSLDFTGNIVLYTTKISGNLLGIPFTYTPDSPPPLLLPDMDFTNVETDQPFAMVGALAADGVHTSAR